MQGIQNGIAFITGGQFEPSTELEILEELKELVRRIDVPNMMLYADHSSNTTGLRGVIPRDKDTVIHRIDDIISRTQRLVLDSHIRRYSM